MKELDLLDRFIKRAPYAVANVRVFRRNIIRRKVVIDGREVMLVNGIPGQGDAEALVRGGRHIEIETKAATGRMRERQTAWKAWCDEWEIPHLILRARTDEAPEATVERWCEELRGAL